MNGQDATGRADWIVPELGFEDETERLRRMISDWIADVRPEMADALQWQFLSGSKYFRPLTVFCCAEAIEAGPLDDNAIRGTMALELFHNMTLVVDDILDRSDERRGKASMHHKFGELKALMTSGYMVAEAYRMVKDDPAIIELLSEMMTRLGAAEVKQWDERCKPLGVEDWRALAREDTGSMFETAACLGDPTGKLRIFGQLLGILYHACDDVSDVRGASALGGGGDEDVRDGILTLPAALAIRDPSVAEMFAEPNEGNYEALTSAFRAVLPEAEAELDRIAEAAIAEAKRQARNPKKLIGLVTLTRNLGRA